MKPGEQSAAAVRETLRSRVLERLAVLDAEQPAAPVCPDFFEQVRNLTLICSSSRGGSSVFTEFLRRSRRMLHFRGEVNAFLVLQRLGWPDSGTGSDQLTADQVPTGDRRLLLERLLAEDCGTPTTRLDTTERRQRFCRDLCIRLLLQWPHVEIPHTSVSRALENALAELVTHHGWAEGHFGDAQLFHAVFLRELRRDHPEVNPHFYDISPALISMFCPHAPVPSGAPGPWILEEPPFVTVCPWEPATRDQARTLPLVVKTPSNAYRLPFFEALVPQAQLNVLHLTRNAAASVNGLVDGWRYATGFFSHRAPSHLALDGYSRPGLDWSTCWWNYDLPPGWLDLLDTPLVDVCARQWLSAHRFTLEYLRSRDPGSPPPLRISFEDLLDPHTARGTLDQVLGWLGIELEPSLATRLVGDMPPIMSTHKPRHQRWFRNAEQLERVWKNPEVATIMRELGYGPDPTTWR
ncbi:MAG: sulfotransferase [Myxococcota bacterium]|jgi:hypothetical protein|nr:sulfotransferase [Myxococcota bacterium]